MSEEPKFNHPMQADGLEGPMPMMAPLSRETSLGKDATLYINPWVGWRAWNLVLLNDDLLLQSITYKQYWMPGERFEAKCIQGRLRIAGPPESKSDHDAPFKPHGCGIHAVTEQGYAAKWMDFQVGEQKIRVVGEVNLWGIVYRYTRGFLAQYAYPKSIYVPHDVPEDSPVSPREAVHELRRRYRGVEVRLL